jgi:predicted nucleotidyltransferase
MNTFVQSLTPLIAEFQRTHGCIRLAYLFGSQADGHARAESDVDVAVLLQDGADALIDLKLGDFLSHKLAKPVDVVVLNQASPILQHEVIRGGVRLMEISPMVRRLHELRAFRDYVDALFFQKQRLMRHANG